MANLREEWRPKFKNARIVNARGHIEHYGCWIESEGHAIIVFDDGSDAAVKLSAFADPMV